MSIMHRLTGVASIVGLFLLSLLFIAAPYGRREFEAVGDILGSWFGLLVLTLFGLSLFYHLCNGIRHLVWDTGNGLDLATVAKSAKIVVAATVILTLILIIV